ncbi:hypothetical protein F7725_009918 [Dissostichus mawsoni]|uniref:Uncharacterized protein n=1 Tax=Dissostichus mawsoni TaxID=36200 RepID=A0A7J5XMC7_DISMA|nr:hypothetical protein F7725_009918 [Dissostichus mawsoni]
MFMWPGTKEPRLKGRANTIKACPYRLVGPEETDRSGMDRTPPTMGSSSKHSTIAHQTVMGSGSRLGSNTRLKHYFIPWRGEWSPRCVFYQLQQVRFLTSCSLEMLLLLTEEGHFLRGFVKR